MEIPVVLPLVVEIQGGWLVVVEIQVDWLVVAVGQVG